MDTCTDADPIVLLRRSYEVVEYASSMILGAHNKCTFQVTLKVNKKKRYVASAPTAPLAIRKAAIRALQDIDKETCDAEEKDEFRETTATQAIIDSPTKRQEEIFETSANAAAAAKGSNEVSRIFVKDVASLNTTTNTSKEDVSNIGRAHKSQNEDGSFNEEILHGVESSKKSQCNEKPTNVGLNKVMNIVDTELTKTSPQNTIKFSPTGMKRQLKEIVLDSSNVKMPKIQSDFIKQEVSEEINEELIITDKEDTGSNFTEEPANPPNKDAITTVEINENSTEKSQQEVSNMEVITTVSGTEKDITTPSVENEEPRNLVPVIKIDVDTDNVGEESTNLIEDMINHKESIIQIDELPTTSRKAAERLLAQKKQTQSNTSDLPIQFSKLRNPFIARRRNSSALNEGNTSTGKGVISLELNKNNFPEKPTKSSIKVLNVVQINKEKVSRRQNVEKEATNSFVENTDECGTHSSVIEIDEGGDSLIIEDTSQAAIPIDLESDDIDERVDECVSQIFKDYPNSAEVIEIYEGGEDEGMTAGATETEENNPTMVDLSIDSNQYTSDVIEVHDEDDINTDKCQFANSSSFTDRCNTSTIVQPSDTEVSDDTGDSISPPDESEAIETDNNNFQRIITFEPNPKADEARTKTNFPKKHPVKRLVKTPISINGATTSEGTTKTKSKAKSKTKAKSIFKKNLALKASIIKQATTTGKTEASDADNKSSLVTKYVSEVHQLERQIGDKFSFHTLGSPNATYIVMSATWNNRQYFGHGRCESLARYDVCQQIVDAKKAKKQSSANNFPLREVSNNFSDMVENLVLTCFREKTIGSPEISDYKVLAGIVLTYNLNFKNAQVIAIATGTKCINGRNLDGSGCALNDCHAEVIARRCLIKFLYTQLLWHCSPVTVEQSIFYRKIEGGFALKPGYDFHLYISSAPCGDARIFSGSKKINNINDNEKYGHLRAKVDGKAGCLHTGNQRVLQSWTNILNGCESLKTMSCSDKIARWNVLGVQGALLSSLIDPIYLRSIVLGSMFHEEHLYRAVCGRLVDHIQSLPYPYRLNFPQLGQVSQTRHAHYDEVRVPGIGINWTVGDCSLEIVSLPTGRVINNNNSYVCKHILFSKYIALLRNLPGIPNMFMSNNYAIAKIVNATNYSRAKYELFNAFLRAGMGCWIQKPYEQNDFRLNEFS